MARYATHRLVVMSWCWNFLADFLWIPMVAYTQDLGWKDSVVSVLFAINLGTRLVPNLAAALLGMRSELVMMGCTVLGYVAAMVWPTDVWALYLMAACSGLAFVRTSLSLHPALVFADDEEGLARVAKYCGAARNLGTLTALVLPVAVYRQVGWSGVCLVAVATVLLYSALATTQYLLHDGGCCRNEVRVGTPNSEGQQPERQQEQQQPEQQQEQQPEQQEQQHTPQQEQQHTQEQQQERAGIASIPWILWVVGAAFVELELQMNIYYAAVPAALTRTFGLQVSTAGYLMALATIASMCFLAWLPSAPRTLHVLHKSPLNILAAFFGIFAAWCAAVVAMVSPPSGLGLFALGVLMFMLTAYMAQVLALECLTGILNVQESKYLMGFSETGGCCFAALGGYLGKALGAYGAAIPFALQACVALVTASVLAASFGHRLIAQRALKRPHCAAAASQGGGWWRQSIAGLSELLLDPPESFVSCEREYRRLGGTAGTEEKRVWASDSSESP